MSFRRIPLLAAAAFVMLGAAAKSVAPELPLIVDGAVVVDAADFEGNLLRIPEDRRGQARTSYDTVATIVDGIYVTRVFAERARQAGIDKDPALQRRMRQVQEGVLADAYVRKLEKESVPPNLEQRARELYRTDPARFTTPEQVYAQHILIDLNGRTKEAARERARKVIAEAKAGEDFLALAAKYSDDRGRRGNAGDLGYNAPTAFSEPVRNALARMKTQGEVSEPVESDAGFHILKFIDRKSPQLQPFEAVKDQIIAAERDRIMKQKVESLIQEVRASPTVTVHRQNVEKLVIPVDQELLKKLPAAAAAK